MHFVFIVGSYYPYYSAVGKCVGNVADVLSQKHKVTIICEKSYCNQKDEDQYNNQKILRIITQDKINRERLNEDIGKTHGLTRKFHILKLNTFKLLQVSKLVFSKISIKKDLVNLYISKLVNIDEKIDVIIPASMPFESVVAALRYKKLSKSEVILIPYLFDQFVENLSLHKLNINMWIKRKKHKYLEKEMLINSKFVLMMKQLGEYFNKNYANFSDIFVRVEHPLILKVDQVIADSNESLNFAYAGSFYKGIRDPEFMLRLFDVSLKKIDGVLNLYTFGNCNKIIRDYTDNNSLIKDNGSLPSNLVFDVIKKSDYLVAVGNLVSNQAPSKIFEYLSIGKPIIYLYTIDVDTNIQVLKKYPYALCLKQEEEFENNISKLLNFCEKNKNIILSYEDVSKIYPDALPEHTASLIEELLRSL